MANDEGLIDVEKVLSFADDLLEKVDELDEQAVEGISKMLLGGLMLADSLADGTIVDKTLDVDGPDEDA